MRVTFLAPLAVMLLACQLPGAPEDEEMLEADSTVIEESLGDDQPPAEVGRSRRMLTCHLGQVEEGEKVKGER